ncbi:MAG: IS21 family transposase [Terriglobia bacterium]
MISAETEAAILRLHYVEKWRKNTIANQLGIHHSVVERVLLANGVSAEQLRMRKTMLDPYVSFIKATFKEYPTLNARRLWQMVRERGYQGAPDHFRHMVVRYRPLRSEEAYLRLSTLPGEQAQVDWASFGRIKIGDAERKLYGFIMVLSWSRHVFLKFYLNQSTANFQRGHLEAFAFFEGHLTREIFYDNLKAAVLERIGKAIHYNPEILALASHYRFKPVPVEVAQPTQKGRVERAVRFARSSFWPARKWTDLDDLNRQARQWCLGEASERRWVQDEKLTVKEAFEQEKQYLLKASEAEFVVYDRKEVRIGKTPYACFDGNLYSVEPGYVRQTLSVFATLETVRICHGLTEVGRHRRCFDKRKVIEDSKHIEELKEAKRAASKHRGIDVLRLAAPSSRDLLVLAGDRGHNLGRLTQELMDLLGLYGGAEVEAAIKEALLSERVHASAVKQALERRRSEKGQKEPVRLHFERNEKANTIIIPTPSLEIYDSLLKRQEEGSNG